MHADHRACVAHHSHHRGEAESPTAGDWTLPVVCRCGAGPGLDGTGTLQVVFGGWGEGEYGGGRWYYRLKKIENVGEYRVTGMAGRFP